MSEHLTSGVNDVLPLLLNISHLARFTCRPSAGPNSSIKCKACSTAERVPAKAPLLRYHAWRRISAHSSSASRLDTNFWRTSVIAISIAANPSVDIEAKHASVIVDFVRVKPYQMMPPLFSVVVCMCGVCVHGVVCAWYGVWCVCVCCVCVCGGVCVVCVHGVVCVRGVVCVFVVYVCIVWYVCLWYMCAWRAVCVCVCVCVLCMCVVVCVWCMCMVCVCAVYNYVCVCGVCGGVCGGVCVHGVWGVVCMWCEYVVCVCGVCVWCVWGVFVCGYVCGVSV